MPEKIKLFDQADLEKVVAEGSRPFATQSTWVNKMVSSFASIVRRRPLAYRSFGPFWWPLKAMMIKSGEMQGEAPDPELVAQVTTGNPALDIAAAWSQHEAYSSQLLAGNTFTVNTESGDTVEYWLYDDEMEERSSLGLAQRT